MEGAPNVKLILGPLVIAVAINTFLYGICILQYIRYFTSEVADRLNIRLLVLWELSVDTFHSALSIYMLWLYVVDNYTNSAFLATAPWPFTSIPILIALSACPMQLFLSYRVKNFSNSWTVFAILVTLSLTEGALAIATAAKALQETEIAAATRFVALVDSWMVLTVVTDVSISAFLIYYLARSRASFRQTKHVVARLIRGAVQTASFASFFSIMLLIVFTLWPTTTLNEIFSIPLGRVYTNTFLAILNSRQSLRREFDGTRDLESDFTSLVFGMHAEATPLTRVNIPVDGLHADTAEGAPAPLGGMKELARASTSRTGSHGRSRSE